MTILHLIRKIDFQVNGALGYIFNDVHNLDEFLKIELAQLKYGKTFIIPTFITDSFDNLKKFVEIVLERISFNEKKYKNFILPKLWGIHFEGPFITNKGAHNENFIKDFNEKNVKEFVEILKPLGSIPIYFTFAPELIQDRFDLLEFMKNELNITISAGHTFISREELEKFDKLPFTLLTHFHNAFLEGHFLGDKEGLPSYVAENGFNGYIGLIADGQHTAKGELIPTILNYYDKMCITSDCAAPSCLEYDSNNNLFDMAGNVSVFEKKDGELPIFFWTDFSKANKDDLEKITNVDELYKLYIEGKVGYKTLAGSAVNLDQCYRYLLNFDIDKELEKSKKNPKTLKLLNKGLAKNNLKESDIKDFIRKNLDKMFFDNQVEALKIDKDIYNYEILVNDGVVELYKNNVLFIRLDDNFDDFLEPKFVDTDKLREKLKLNLCNFFKKND